MRTIQEILKDIASIADKYTYLHLQSMSLCQEWVFNGFKRYHRIKSKEFYNIVIKLENKAFDYYNTKIKIDKNTLVYEPSNILGHFQAWLSMIEIDLKTIGDLNKEFFEKTGFEAPCAYFIKCTFLKEIEKIKRKLNRFKQIGAESTALHDLHRQDDELHKKLKELEQKNDI